MNLKIYKISSINTNKLPNKQLKIQRRKYMNMKKNYPYYLQKFKECYSKSIKRMT